MSLNFPYNKVKKHFNIFFLHIMSHKIGESWTNNTLRECVKSEEEPGSNEQDKVSGFKRLRLLLEICNQSAKAKEHITRIMNKQHQDSASQAIDQIWKEDQKDCHTMMQKHLPEFWSSPFVYTIVNKGMQMAAKLNHVK